MRKADGSGTEFAENEGPQFPKGQGGEEGGKGGPEGEYVMGEVEAGALVLIHGNLLHKSERNLSGKGRIIYTFHAIEGDQVYDGRNWLQPPAGGFTKI